MKYFLISLFILMSTLSNSVYAHEITKINVKVCYTTLKKGGNPFLEKGPFQCSQTIETQLNEKFPKAKKPAITGKQISEVVKKFTIKEKIIGIKAINTTQDKPFKYQGMITIDTSENEFFDNYVFENKDGKYTLYLELDIE